MQLNAAESTIVKDPKSSKMTSCSKTVFHRVSAGLVSQKYFTCAPQTNQGDSLKIDGPGGMHFHQLNRVWLVFISIRGETFLEESQEEPFQGYTGLIPEEGFILPNQDCRVSRTMTHAMQVFGKSRKIRES